MLAKNDTKLELFGFGENPDDIFYCLVNLTKSPEGVDLKKLSAADPRRFDEVLNSMGCLLLLNGEEVEELIKRDEITNADLHQSIYDLAVREKIIT